MSLINDRQDEDYSSSNDDAVSRSVDDCGKRIPSQLRGSVVVFVNLEDILMYIIIVYCCTPIGDVLSSFQDVIIVYGH